MKSPKSPVKLVLFKTFLPDLSALNNPNIVDEARTKSDTLNRTDKDSERLRNKDNKPLIFFFY